MVTNKNAMKLGVEVLNWTPQPDKYLNDNIHPCVRYISGGFAGHKFWMTTSPYPNSNAQVENVILYWGDSPDGGITPPLTWKGGTVVVDTPATGYNSDPNIYYDGTKLWIFWRENSTPDAASVGGRATFGVYTTDGTTFSQKKMYAPLSFAIDGKEGDSEMCPIVMNVNGKLRLYASYYEFTPNRHPYGLAIWDIANNDLINNTFKLTKYAGMLYKPGFNFWHFDMFTYNSMYYCIVTPEEADQILLGVSSDGENFKFWSMPLLSTAVCGAVYMYKPSAMVYNSILYVWHPVKINGISRIYMSSGGFDNILATLNNSISVIS
jgi:hypothetical protein